jgi:hypothetical protein
MKLISRSIKFAALSLLLAGASVQAAEFIVDDAAGARRGANSKVMLVGFSGSADITDSQVDLTYDPALVSVSVKALGNAGCSNPKAGLIRVVSPDLGGKALGEKVGAYCEVTVKAIKGTLPADAVKAVNAFCSGAGGVEKSCGAENALIK